MVAKTAGKAKTVDAGDAKITQGKVEALPTPSAPSETARKRNVESLREVMERVERVDLKLAFDETMGEPKYDHAELEWCESDFAQGVENKTEELVGLYQRLDWAELSDDLEACDTSARRRFSRLRFYHAPLVRIWLAGETNSAPWRCAVARGMTAAISAVRERCSQSICAEIYSPWKSNGCDEGLFESVRAVLDMARKFGVSGIDTALDGVLGVFEAKPYNHGATTAKISWLETVALDDCETAMEEWCSLQGDALAPDPFKDLKVVRMSKGWTEIDIPGKSPGRVNEYALTPKESNTNTKSITLKAIWEFCQEKKTPVFSWNDVKRWSDGKPQYEGMSITERLKNRLFAQKQVLFAELFRQISDKNEEYELKVRFEEV